MNYTYDDQLIDTVAVRRHRLTTALILGSERSRRDWSARFRILLGSFFLAAVACAACVGVSFAIHLISSDHKAHPKKSPHPTTSTHRTTPVHPRSSVARHAPAGGQR